VGEKWIFGIKKWLNRANRWIKCIFYISLKYKKNKIYIKEFDKKNTPFPPLQADKPKFCKNKIHLFTLKTHL